MISSQNARFITAAIAAVAIAFTVGFAMRGIHNPITMAVAAVDMQYLSLSEQVTGSLESRS